MLCLSCGRIAQDLCATCRACLVEAPDRLLAGLLVRSCFEHSASARSLVHSFKYRGSDRAGWLLARALSFLVPPGAVLVPLPRASWRTIAYGIDPAVDLARRVGRLNGAEVWTGLEPQIYRRPQAGRSRSDRDPPIFSLRGQPPETELVLLDDVVTTGRTLQRAHALLVASAPRARILLAVSATSTRD